MASATPISKTIADTVLARAPRNDRFATHSVAVRRTSPCRKLSCDKEEIIQPVRPTPEFRLHQVDKGNPALVTFVRIAKPARPNAAGEGLSVGRQHQHSARVVLQRGHSTRTPMVTTWSWVSIPVMVASLPIAASILALPEMPY